MASFFNLKGQTMSHTDIARPVLPLDPALPTQPLSGAATLPELSPRSPPSSPTPPTTATSHVPFDALTALAALKPYLCVSQLAVLSEGLGGEERGYFIDVIAQLTQTLATMPVTYEQGPLGDEALVHLHYFLNGCDWWITELDLEDQVSQAFGMVQLNGYPPELGYISITELVSLGVEFDLHWQVQTLSQIRLHLAGACAHSGADGRSERLEIA
jgi:hypothetical protein